MLIKNVFDYILALILLFFLVGLIVLLTIITSIDTKSFGIFTQNRVGMNARIFKIYKLKTMIDGSSSSITTNKHSITKFGRILRKYKLDELPQLFNILKGDMSFVGPRPDVIGYADNLKGDDCIILTVKPGITGPAQIKYRNEQQILSEVDNPKEYNDQILWPDKVRINKDYVRNWSFKKDLLYIYRTIIKKEN